LFDQHARGDHQRRVELADRHAVVEAFQRFVQYQLGVDTLQARAGFGNDGFEAAEVEEFATAIGTRDMQRRMRLGGLRIQLGGALARVLFAIDDDRKSTRLNSSHVKISYAVFRVKRTIFKPSMSSL